jgi:hypothetical protein
MMVAPNSPYKSFEDMLAADEPVKFAASGVGSAAYLDTRILDTVYPELDIETIAVLSLYKIGHYLSTSLSLEAGGETLAKGFNQPYKAANLDQCKSMPMNRIIFPMPRRTIHA